MFTYFGVETSPIRSNIFRVNLKWVFYGRRIVNKHIEEVEQEFRRSQTHLGMSDSSLMSALAALATYSYFFRRRLRFG